MNLPALLFPLALLFAAFDPLAAQVRITGPMPGHADMLESTIWLQCDRAASVLLEYWAMEMPDSILRTQELRAAAEEAFVLKFRMAPVVPGNTYGYRVVANGQPLDLGPLQFRTQPLWRFRTDPPDMVIAMGSCTYVNEPAYDRPGKPYGDGYRIFDRIADQKPDLMLWLGDNIYLREPDWGSWSGILHRYTHTRSLPEMQRLLRSTHHYAIWDDHDFGHNDAVGTFANAHLTRRAFDLFWANPTSGVPGADGITTMFNWSDVDFFLLDDRTFRTLPNLRTSEPALLGQAQLDWLIQSLVASSATFKVVAMGSQFLNTARVFENYAQHALERQQLIDRIDQEGITGVIFVTGDRHFTELSELKLPDGRSIYDLTTSPLTSGTHQPSETNALAMPDTRVVERNFAVLRVSGPRHARKLVIEIRDSEGGLKWTREITTPQKR
ncbi:MAG: alkaline phosphatase family protein [Flavobacteriales bacterium]|nr:alkaline phosphatase family protein [Flavobacteriales bacterium]